VIYHAAQHCVLRVACCVLRVALRLKFELRVSCVKLQVKQQQANSNQNSGMVGGTAMRSGSVEIIKKLNTKHEHMVC
jgi:hypothetical protein